MPWGGRLAVLDNTSAEFSYPQDRGDSPSLGESLLDLGLEKITFLPYDYRIVRKTTLRYTYLRAGTAYRTYRTEPLQFRNRTELIEISAKKQLRSPRNPISTLGAYKTTRS